MTDEGGPRTVPPPTGLARGYPLTAREAAFPRGVPQSSPANFCGSPARGDPFMSPLRGATPPRRYIGVATRRTVRAGVPLSARTLLAPAAAASIITASR